MPNWSMETSQSLGMQQIMAEHPEPGARLDRAHQSRVELRFMQKLGAVGNCSTCCNATLYYLARRPGRSVWEGIEQLAQELKEQEKFEQEEEERKAQEKEAAAALEIERLAYLEEEAAKEGKECDLWEADQKAAEDARRAAELAREEGRRAAAEEARRRPSCAPEARRDAAGGHGSQER